MFPRNFNEGIKSGFIPYMLEASGYDNLCSTKQAKINAVIKDFKSLIDKRVDPNLYKYEILASHGLSEQLLTDAECAKIKKEVEKYANR